MVLQAGPGLFKALARHASEHGHSVGILPSWMGRTNHHHTPYWGVVLFLAVSALVTAAASAHDQELVLFYAVSVFMSFLAGLLAMTRFSYRERRRGPLVMNGVGAVVVTFTLVVNIARGRPIASAVSALGVAAGLYQLWARAGRPRGIAEAVAEAEHYDVG